jgi:hypothetical protein
MQATNGLGNSLSTKNIPRYTRSIWQTNGCKSSNTGVLLQDRFGRGGPWVSTQAAPKVRLSIQSTISFRCRKYQSRSSLTKESKYRIEAIIKLLPAPAALT